MPTTHTAEDQLLGAARAQLASSNRVRHQLAEEVIDIPTLAVLAGVSINTVLTWNRRRLLPTPSGKVSGRPWWWWAVIRTWLIDTNRRRDEELPE